MKTRFLFFIPFISGSVFAAVIPPPSMIDTWAGNTAIGVTNVVKAIAGTSTNSSGDMKGASNLTDVASVGLSRTNIGANNGSNITQGTIADARLSTNVAFLTDIASATNASSITASVNSTNLQNLTAMGVTTNEYVQAATNAPTLPSSVNATNLTALNNMGIPLKGSANIFIASNTFTDIGVTGNQTVGTLTATNVYLNLSTSTNSSGSLVAFQSDLAAATNAATLTSTVNSTNATSLNTILNTSQYAPKASPVLTGVATIPAFKSTTNNLTLAVDFTAGNYVFITTNNNLTISGFTGIDAGVASVQWQVHSVSNSAATAITYGWPAGVTLYGTNSGTSLSIPGGKKLKATFSIDPHGTNLCVVTSN